MTTISQLKKEINIVNEALWFSKYRLRQNIYSVKRSKNLILIGVVGLTACFLLSKIKLNPKNRLAKLHKNLSILSPIITGSLAKLSFL